MIESYNSSVLLAIGRNEKGRLRVIGEVILIAVVVILITIIFIHIFVLVILEDNIGIIYSYNMYYSINIYDSNISANITNRNI